MVGQFRCERSKYLSWKRLESVISRDRTSSRRERKPSLDRKTRLYRLIRQVIRQLTISQADSLSNRFAEMNEFETVLDSQAASVTFRTEGLRCIPTRRPLPLFWLNSASQFLGQAVASPIKSTGSGAKRHIMYASSSAERNPPWKTLFSKCLQLAHPHRVNLCS
jgi:hypothetical protein